MSYGAKQYKKTSVTTASRGQILIMLYEAAIRNVKKASKCLEEGDLSGKGKWIGKTHDIINELSSTLDFEVGGDIARELEALYTFMVDQLIKGNMENDKKSLDAVAKVLSNLLEGWRVAVAEFESKNKQEANGSASFIKK